MNSTNVVPIKHGYNLKNDCGNAVATFPARASPAIQPGAARLPGGTQLPSPQGSVPTFPSLARGRWRNTRAQPLTYASGGFFQSKFVLF